MNSKSTKAELKAIRKLSLAQIDERDGVERFDHLDDPIDKWLQEEKRKRKTEGKLDAAD